MSQANTKAVAKTALARQAASAGALTGLTGTTATSKLNAPQAYVLLNVDAITGTPTTTSITGLKVQDSADGTTFADLFTLADQAALAANTSYTVEVPGSMNNARAYVRVIGTAAFVGGTSPTVGVSAALVYLNPQYAE